MAVKTGKEWLGMLFILLRKSSPDTEFLFEMYFPVFGLNIEIYEHSPEPSYVVRLRVNNRKSTYWDNFFVHCLFYFSYT